MLERAYVLYATDNYYDVVHACAESIRAVSDVPIFVYFINSDIVIIDIEDVTSIRWNFEMSGGEDMLNAQADGNFYVNRDNLKIFKLFFQRPLVVLDALKRAKTIAYIDSDSVATPYVDRIFSLYDENATYPYVTEGIYDWLHKDGRGGADSRDDLSTTLEHAACSLLGVNQYVREEYRTTNLFVAGQNAIPFVQEWWDTCNHPVILANPTWFAPYHEETLINVLLWKYNYLTGLSYVHMNGSIEEAIKLVEEKDIFKGAPYYIGHWKRVPARKEDLLVMHGEKRPEIMRQMAEKLRQLSKLRVLFLAPHLSTGGMPAFLLKRIQAIQKYTDIDVHVVEYANHSDHFVVQKNQIKELVKNFWTLGEDKMELIDIIKNNSIDIVHIEEMVEDGHNNWPDELRRALYSNNRTWRMVETCHNIVFKPDIEKRYHPEAYAFCTPHHLKTFANMPSRKAVIEFPIEKQYSEPIDLGPGPHVVNVGLWTPGKNQGEAVELAKQMPDVQFHFVGNQAGNFQHYWEPIMKDLPSNVHVWGERHDVGAFMAAADIFLFNSTFECNPLVLREAIGYKLPILARNLPQYGDMFTPYITDLKPEKLEEQLRDMLQVNVMYDIPEDQEMDFGLKHLGMYKKVMDEPIRKQLSRIDVSFVDQPFLEVKSDPNSLFLVKFFDEAGNEVYANTIKTDNWIRLSRTWFTRWTIKVWENDSLILDYTLNYKGKRVYIAFDSSSLGDTIAWMPYALEFKKKHNCHVIVSTFKNFLFQDAYPELEFVTPGTQVENVFGKYTLGWFYNEDREPALPNTIPLQKAATNILGLDYQELRPRIVYTPRNKFDGKIVTIATNSTAGCKFWTREAWQELIDFLDRKGYRIINVSLEDNPFERCQPLDDKSMQNTMDAIASSEFFIGLSSGLSWLAWAMEKPVVMIANFTDEDHEFSCIRITNKNVCHGCWNKAEYKFDKGDWDWCPVNKGTYRQFECQKSISAINVVEKLMPLLT